MILVSIQQIILIAGNRKKLAFTISLRVISFFLKVGREDKDEGKEQLEKLVNLCRFEEECSSILNSRYLDYYFFGENSERLNHHH